MVYVNASSDESCNLPMCEANACGIPAVVFDCRGEYSDHCDYIKYGIVVNHKHKCNIKAFSMAIEWIRHYHLCTRGLGISCLLPLSPQWKFYDFPMSFAEWTNDNPKHYEEAISKQFGAKEWHRGALKECYGILIKKQLKVV